MRSSAWTLLVASSFVALGPTACGSADEGAFSGTAGADSGSATTTTTSNGASGSGGGATGGGDTGGRPTGSSSTTTGTGCLSAGDACTECESMKCGAEYCACYENPSCVKLAQCDVPCSPGDLSCHQACWTANPAGISDGALLADCAAKNCSAGCPGLTALTPCQKCLYDQCPTAMNPCIANPECTNLLYCLAACADMTCQNDCYSKHPGGLDAAGPVGTCATSQCAATCS